MPTPLRAAAALAISLLAAAPVCVRPLAAQRADSADAARSFYRQSRSAWANSDTTAAFVAAVSAAAAWPRQGAYQRYLARVAAATGHPEAALAALDATTEMGFGWDPRDPEWSALVDLPRFELLAHRVREALAPMPSSTLAATLLPSFQHAEGVAYDQRTGRRFVSSVRQRKIVTVDATGTVSDFITNAEPRLYAVFGMIADPLARVLWVTTTAMKEQEGRTGADSGKSELRAYHLDSGRPLGRWRLPESEPHCLGDVTLAPDGAVYTSDSCQPQIFRATLDGKLTSLAATHPDWRNLQGIAFAPDGCTAYVADWTTGLYRINLGDNTVTPVAADPRIVTLGLDGLYWGGDNVLIGIQNGITPPRVIRVTLSADGNRVVALTVLDRNPLATEPSLGVVLDGALLYVANSSWSNYNAEGAPQSAFESQLLLRLAVPGLHPVIMLRTAPRCS